MNKIAFSLHKKAILDDLVAEGLLNESLADQIVERIDRFLELHLMCTNCRNVLPDELFYKSTAHKSRRNRLPVCKTCHPMIYGKR